MGPMKGESLMVKPGFHRHLHDAHIVLDPKNSSGKKGASGMTRSSNRGLTSNR
jgi:hypothetical protein